MLIYPDGGSLLFVELRKVRSPLLKRDGGLSE